MNVTVQSRGNRGFSLHWVTSDGSRGNKYLGDISREEAWRMAGRMEAELEGSIIRRHTWDEFRRSFEAVYYNSLKPSTIKKQRHALDVIEQKIHPKYLDEVTALKLYEAIMSMDITPNSARSIMGHARAAIRWAHRMQLISEVPDFSMPKGKSEPSKGRPLTPDEVERFIAAIPEVVKNPSTAQKYKNLTIGILLSAFRISEAIVAEWNSDTAPVTILTNGEKPILIFREQKADRKSILPCLPDFIDFLTGLDGSRESGKRVFGLHVHPYRASKVLSRVGKESGIIVSTNSNHRGKPKFASAHDLRRTFAARWAEVLPESILAAIMRHRSPETTRKHYAIMDAERILHAVEEATKRRDE